MSTWEYSYLSWSSSDRRELVKYVVYGGNINILYLSDKKERRTREEVEQRAREAFSMAMAELGRQGWEAINFRYVDVFSDNGRVYFKRPVIQS